MFTLIFDAANIQQELNKRTIYPYFFYIYINLFFNALNN